MSESEDRISLTSASVHTYPDSTSSENYSRSSQQVPQIHGNFNGHMEKNVFQSYNSVPFLNITEQPSDTFRFRYKSEMVGTHGCLLGENSKKSREKSYPGVELCNYSGRARIRCSLAQVNGKKLSHPHRLLVDDKDEDVVQEVDARKGYRVVFSGMGIIHTAKKNVADELYLKKKSQLTLREIENWKVGEDYNLKAQCEEDAKSINLNQVCLRYSAHRIEDDTDICPPVYTFPINNLKSAMTNDLKIVRISKVKGKCKGGDDVFIFVEKVTKKNIKVRFFEFEDETRLWEAYGTFSQSDVHHQYGIVFQTPPYKDVRLSKSQDVWVELVRPSDGKVSEAVKFTYQADPSAAHAPGKRRRAQLSTLVSSLGSSAGSFNSMDLPTTLQTALNITKPATEEPMAIHTLMRNITPDDQMNTHREMLGDALMESFDTPSLLSSSALLLNKLDGVSLASVPDATAGDVAMSGELNSSAILNQVLLNQDAADSAEFRNFLNNCTESYMEILSQNAGILQRDGVRVQTVDQKAGQSATNISPPRARGKGPLYNDEQFCQTLEPEVKIEKESCSEHEEEYTATYNAADGERVQRLVSELEGLLTSPCHESSVFSKVEELMDIKLSNGDSSRGWSIHYRLALGLLASVPLTSEANKLITKRFVHMSIQNNILATVKLVVKLLVKLDLPEKMNIQNSRGDTVLHSAVLCDHPTIIPILVQAGCNPNIEDTEGNTPLHHAINYARHECLHELLAADKTNNVPEYKINFNALNSEGHSALHLCAMTSSVSGTAALLGRGADVNVADPAGRTALHLATKAALQDGAEISKAYKVVVILLQSKAYVDAVDKDGNTALRIACRDSKAYDIIKLLLEKGADPMKALIVTDDGNQDDDDDDDDVSQEHVKTADCTRTLVNVLNEIGKVEMADIVFKKYYKG